jgi:P4 family phage/plasmid primase-like protien
MPPDVEDAARTWFLAGACILPAAPDGTKKPAVPWKAFQQGRPSSEVMASWPWADITGIGMLTGSVSGNVEMLEAESQAVAEGLHKVFLDSLPYELHEKINTYVEKSPTGGIHWLYRVADEKNYSGPPVAGNTKLARRPAPELPNRVRVLFETRGEGGWTILAPSHGPTHPSGKPWVILSGKPGVLPTLTQSEVRFVHTVIATFDEMPAPDVVDKHVPIQPKTAADPDTPGNDFARRTTWAEILEPHGWRVVRTRGDITEWVRPGKNARDGGSATTNYAGKDNLWVFTTSTEFDSETSYTKFGAYAVLNHGGHHPTAARALRAEGYGKQPEPTVRPLTLVKGGEATTGPAMDGSTALKAEKIHINATLNDDGNALLMVDHIENRLLYCPERKQWLEWSGGHWNWLADNGPAVEAFRVMIREIDPQGDPVIAKHKHRSQSWNAISHAVTLAEKDPRVAVHINDLDADPYQLNTPGGGVNLYSGEVSPNTPESRHTRLTRVAPDFSRKPERFLAFMAQTFAGHPELIPYIQRLIGYSIIGKVTHHILPFLHGAGANGKTVLLDIFIRVLGDYATVQPADFLLARGNDNEHETVIARLSGQRLVVCSEVNPRAKFNEQKVKLLTGGDLLIGRFMRENHFTFLPTHHLWLVANHEPNVEVGGNSIWRRIRKIPFVHSVPEDQQNPNLANDLVELEGPAILAWIIAGAIAHHNGLQEPEIVREATEEYKETEDQTGRFLAEIVKRGGGDLAKVETTAMREAYNAWCMRNNEKPAHSGTKQFGQEMASHGIEVKKSNGRRWYLDVTVMNAERESERPEQQGWFK